MGLYLAAASLNQAALAQAQAHRAATCWIGCARLFMVINVSGVLNPFRVGRDRLRGLRRSARGAALRHLPNPMASAADEIEPGSPRELQAQLTATDEMV